MNAANTVTGNYVIQWEQTFTHTGLSVDATGTVVTVNAVAEDICALPFKVFVDGGAVVTYAYQDLVSSSVSR